MSATIGKNKPQNAHNLGGLKTVKVSMSPPPKKKSYAKFAKLANLAYLRININHKRNQTPTIPKNKKPP
jgi:hypothetical protein